LYDFDPAKDRVAYDMLPELDRWALLRLGELIPKVRTAYDAYEFHAIFHALNNFCSVDLSAVYLDILKDRLYTFRKDAHERRSSQTVLYDVLVALTKLMAPVLSFTADEIWQMLPEAARKEAAGVHLASFPKADPKWADAKLAERWAKLLEVRTAVQASLEEKRRDKIIGSSLEASVVLRVDDALQGILKPYADDLTTLFIVSRAALERGTGSGMTVEVKKADGEKCGRCWNYRPAVGTFTDHPTLCDRCVEAIR
jgi:isoleucyl-tRNA synthetase